MELPHNAVKDVGGAEGGEQGTTEQKQVEQAVFGDSRSRSCCVTELDLEPVSFDRQARAFFLAPPDVSASRRQRCPGLAVLVQQLPPSIRQLGLVGSEESKVRSWWRRVCAHTQPTRSPSFYA